MRHSNLAQKPKLGKVRTESFALKGGLNLVDAPLTIPPGMCLSAINYELLSTDGYRRIDGFERSDGQPKPSEASYWILNYDAGTIAFSEGDIVDGATSGAQGKCLVNGVGTTAAGYLVLASFNGTSFQDGEDLEVSATKQAEADGIETQRGASTATLDATYLQDAIETQRALVLKMGSGDGSGAVLGLHVYQGTLYGWRNNSGATAANMWKQTASGWSQITFGNEVEFNAGTTELVDGLTLTQGGTTAPIIRVCVRSGSFGGSDAAGHIVIGTVTSGPFAAGAATDGASGACTLVGAETAISLPAGGRYEGINHNFFGASQTQRMYFVNGVGPCNEFDGTNLVPVRTTNTTDTPQHIAINEAHLQLSFPNGSLQNSDTGLPYKWAGGGFDEIGCGDDIVGLKKEVGGPLAIICKARTFALHGKNTTAQPWDLQTIDEEAGGIEWTIQRIGRTRYLDDRGFVSIDAVQEYGSFAASTFSQVIEPLTTAKKELVISSIISRKKTQTRTYFSDGSGIITTFKNKKLSGFTTVRYQNEDGDAIPASCTANGEDSNGTEVMFFGSDDGYVYQLDSGTSFDGNPVTSTFVLAYNNLGSPAYDKQFLNLVIESEGAQGAVIKYTTKFDYDKAGVPSGIEKSYNMVASQAYWNEAVWNQFNWSTGDVELIEDDIDGLGRTIGLQVTSEGTYINPHTLFSATYHYVVRNLARGG